MDVSGNGCRDRFLRLMSVPVEVISVPKLPLTGCISTQGEQSMADLNRTPAMGDGRTERVKDMALGKHDDHPRVANHVGVRVGGIPRDGAGAAVGSAAGAIGTVTGAIVGAVGGWLTG